MTACCVQKVPNVRFPHFLLSAFPIILFMLVRSGRDVISSLVTLRLVPHDITARHFLGVPGGNGLLTARRLWGCTTSSQAAMYAQAASRRRA